MCACGKGKAKQGWRITYPNGTSIVTTSTATKVMAEASGATVEAMRRLAASDRDLFDRLAADGWSNGRRPDQDRPA